MRIDGTRSNDRTTELVLDFLAAFNRGDWAGMLELLDDGIVHDFDPGRRETGKVAFAAYLHARAENRKQLRDIVVMTSPDGARAAAEYMAHGECEAAAPSRVGVHRQRYALPGGTFFAVRDGLIARVGNYQQRADRAAAT